MGRVTLNTPPKSNLSKHGVGKPTLWHVDESQSVAVPAPTMTQTLDADFFTDLLLAPSPQEGGQQALDRLLTDLAMRKYSQPVKDEREVVSGTRLSSTPSRKLGGRRGIGKVGEVVLSEGKEGGSLR